MSEATLHWLDTALVDGRLLDGHAVVSGDLDDWPFRAGERGQAAKGLFEANGRLDGAVVKFQPDWPAADHLARSEDRRVGKECVSTCRTRWSPYNEKKKN